MSTREEVEALGFKIPDFVEPIVAYRSWVLIEGMGVFSHNNCQWIPGKPLEAECMHWGYLRYGTRKLDPEISRHKAPKDGCTCGIYAAKKEEARALVPTGRLYGEVYLWGEILESDRGFRAEFCYPKQFFVPDFERKQIVEKFGFGVPVTVVKGVPFEEFPFPLSFPYRSLRSLLSLSGLPALAVVVVDSLILNMSNIYNQVLVGVTGLAGLLLLTLNLHIRKLRKRLNSV